MSANYRHKKRFRYEFEVFQGVLKQVVKLWKFQGVGGSFEDPLEWKFQGVGGSKNKKPSVGGVWIFSGTTHFSDILACNESKKTFLDNRY